MEVETCKAVHEEKKATQTNWERQVLENLVQSTLREQKSSRRWNNFFRLSWLCIVVYIIYSLSGSTEDDQV